MLAVGLRLPEDVFSAPAEPIAKLPNGNENPTMILDGIDKDTKKAHIKRIILNRTAKVELLRVESPSRIWVRLKNHTTEIDLTFREPYKLQPVVDICDGDYALAPIDERVYRRCQIIKTENENGLINIFFIDDATTAWVKRECLAVMEEGLMFYPWQAIQISMFGVYPAVGDMAGSNEQLWSPQTCLKLSQILGAFPVLKVEVAISTVVFNDYAKPIPVTLMGLPVDVDKNHPEYRPMSIAQILVGGLPMPEIVNEDNEDNEDEETREEEQHREERDKEPIVNNPPEIVCMDLFDAAFHEIFNVAEREEIPREPLDVHREFPKDWKQTSDLEEEEAKEKEGKLFAKDSLTPELESADWDPRQNKIEMLTIEELENKFLFPEPRNHEKVVMMAVEGRCTKSPYEWYARPIHKVGKNEREENVLWGSEPNLREVDEQEWIIYGNDQLSSFAEQLDTFYSNTKNRKPLRSQEIQAMRSEKRDVFAVCAVNEEKGYYTGEWQRVLIVDCDIFAEVQFLDSGGHDMVLTSSLYRIHRQHCRFPPMCLRFALHGVSSERNRGRPDGKWHSLETSRFRMSLREDTPIFININDIAKMPAPAEKECRPHMAKHVLMVKDVSYMDEARTLINRFVDDRETASAVRNENEPAEWPLF